MTAAALEGCTSAAARVAALMAIEAIVPPALAADAELVAAITGHLDRIEREGALAALRA